ncbi:MAG: translation initiation factor IF-1 [Patescibacteria group bacterium]
MDQNINKPQNNNTAYGVVTEALPDTLFRVQLDGKDDIVLAYLAGKMRMHRIRVLIGDKVELTLEPSGGRARITKRL